MSLINDIIFLKTLPLDGFKQIKHNTFNFRCPICGDSKKTKSKKRGYAFEHKGELFVKCFNCGISQVFRHFLEFHFNQYYSDYKKTELSNFFETNKKEKINESIDLFGFEYESLNLELVKNLPKSHKAKQYLHARKISENYYENFYYTDHFMKWVHEHINRNLFKDSYDILDKRIVIPYFNQFKKIFLIQGRSIDNKNPKYLTVKFDEKAKKIYGLDKINFHEKIYILEGPIDSLFIPNSLALGGTLSNLNSIIHYSKKENFIIVPDNDKRNKETNSFIKESIQSGFKTTLWPKNFIWKDINEAIISGLTEKEILDIINSNIFEGLKAKLIFSSRI